MHTYNYYSIPMCKSVILVSDAGLRGRNSVNTNNIYCVLEKLGLRANSPRTFLRNDLIRTPLKRRRASTHHVVDIFRIIPDPVELSADRACETIAEFKSTAYSTSCDMTSRPVRERAAAELKEHHWQFYLPSCSYIVLSARAPIIVFECDRI